jgi:hypothetical protein
MDVILEIYERDYVEELMPLSVKYEEKPMLNQGNRAFSSCLEKFRLIGFSIVYDYHRSNQNQRYAFNLKNFDTKNCNINKIYYNELIRT